MFHRCIIDGVYERVTIMRKMAAFAVILLLLAASCAWAAPKRVTLLLDGSGTDLKESYNGKLAESMRNAEVRFGPKKLSAQLLNAGNDLLKLQPYLEEAAADSDVVLIAAPFYLKYLPAVKKAHPACTFVAIDAGSEPAAGALKVDFRDEEGGFLAGALAAMMTTRSDVGRVNPDKKIGMIMGTDIPATQRFKKGYIAGARYIDPQMDILTEYTYDFADKDKAAAAALRLKEQGADIIFCAVGAASVGAMEAAERGGYWTIGADSQMEQLFPHAVLASALKLSGHVVYRLIEASVRGTLPSADISLGMKEDCIDISTWSRESKVNIPVDIKKRLDEIEDKMSNGLIIVKDINYQSIK